MKLEQLGPYRISRRIGRGGMGAVYSAVHQDTGELAAVKVLSPSLGADEGFRERFQAEIESLKKLKHSNIVRLFGYGEQDGHLYYVMELIEGTSLEEELQAGRRYSWREVTQLTLQMCRALKHAHDRGVIHRDIKPANLLVTADGQLKLSDFGIARLFGNTGLTMAGGVVGTAEFMAPEQAEGRPVTAQCDLYSLGGVMYALLAGRPPFVSKSVTEMLHMQRYATPDPVSRYARDVPADLEQVISRLLEKEPIKRFPNAAILGRQLAAMEHGLSVAASDLSAHIGETKIDPGWFEDEIEHTGTGDSDPFAPTRVVDTSMPQPSVAERSARTALEQTLAAAPTATTKPKPVAQPERTNRFTSLEEEERRVAELAREAEVRHWRQVGLLAVALLALIGGLWWLSRPASANKLMERIDAASAVDDPEALLGAEPEITDFLNRFPDDPRAAKVTALSGRIEEIRAQRRLLRDIDSELRKANDLARTDLPQARVIWQGVIDIYRDKPWAAERVAKAQTALDKHTPEKPN